MRFTSQPQNACCRHDIRPKVNGRVQFHYQLPREVPTGQPRMALIFGIPVSTARGGDEWKSQVYEGEIRWKRLRGVGIHRELEQMLGSEARFRGLQEPVLQAIMKHQSLGNNEQTNMKHRSPIVVVMGTGIGKTLFSSCQPRV